MSIETFQDDTALSAAALNTALGRNLPLDGSQLLTAPLVVPPATLPSHAPQLGQVLPVTGGPVDGTIVQGTSASPLSNVGAVNAYAVANQDTGGFSIVQYRTTVLPKADGSGPNVNAWSVFSGVTVSALAPVNNGTLVVDSGAHVALVGQINRTLPPSGATQPTTQVPMAQTWAWYGANNDQTGLPSSLSGAMPFSEADYYANDVDDATGRAGHVINFGVSIPLANGGKPGAASSLLFTNTVDGASVVGSLAWLCGTYANAVIDTRYAAAGLVGVTGKVTTAAAQGATTLDVSDIRPFMVGGNMQQQQVSPTNPIYNVLIGANYYTVTGFTLQAGTTAGTITLASPGLVNGTDGAVDSVYGRIPAALWMQTGQQVVFDAQSNYRMGYSTAKGGIYLTGSGGLYLDGVISAPSGGIGNLTATYSFVSLGTATFKNGIIVQGGAITVDAVATGSLPTASSVPSNSLLWASDALTPGDTPGAGKGALVVPNAQGTGWKVVGSNAPVSTTSAFSTRTATIAAEATLTAEDACSTVFLNIPGAPVPVVLPAPASVGPGWWAKVCDIKGNASTANPATFTSGAGLINGASSFVASTPYFLVTPTTDGTDFVIN